jgi:endosialidase-like protein
MSEVSSWSETDASNNLTPPDGWPEGMQPSGVNNCGRMMMGSIKRWYNTVSAGIANCLPLSGGTLTGPLIAPQLTSTGAISATGGITAASGTITGSLTASNLHSLGNVNADGALTATSGTITGTLTTSTLHSLGNVSADGALTAASGIITGTLTTSTLHSLGNVSADGTLTAASGTITGSLTASTLHSLGNVSADGTLTAASGTITGALTASTLHSLGNVSADGALTAASGTITGSLTASTVGVIGNLTSGSLNTTTLGVSGNITSGSLNTTTLGASGNATVSGNITSGSLNTTTLGVSGSATVSGNQGVSGTLTVNGLANAGSYQINGAAFAAHGSDGAGPFNAIYDGQGGVALALYGTGGSYYRCDNAHAFTNRAATVNIVRFQVTDGVCQNASGSWSTLSDEALKENVQPYNAGLQALLALEPVSFRYTENAPFGAGQKHYGLIAQEVEAVLPEMVGRFDDTDYRTLMPGHLVFVLLNAVKELEVRLAQLEGR